MRGNTKSGPKGDSLYANDSLIGRGKRLGKQEGVRDRSRYYYRRVTWRATISVPPMPKFNGAGPGAE